MQLTGKTAIVTGGGRGIGRAIVRAFARAGAQVVVADIDEPSGQAAAQEAGTIGPAGLFFQTDTGDRGAVDALIQATVDRCAALDILVNNAGLTGENGHFLNVDPETWERVVRVNQTGVFHCGQAAARVMARRGRGVIINISSVNGAVPQPRCVAYAAAKAAVESMTKSMAIDLAPYGIRANGIAPGPIQTHLPDDAPPLPNPNTLLNRNGLADEIAAVALFLATDASAYITGQTLVVDGGKLVNAYAIYGMQPPIPDRDRTDSSQ